MNWLWSLVNEVGGTVAITATCIFVLKLAFDTFFKGRIEALKSKLSSENSKNTISHEKVFDDMLSVTKQINALFSVIYRSYRTSKWQLERLLKLVHNGKLLAKDDIEDYHRLVHINEKLVANTKECLELVAINGLFFPIEDSSYLLECADLMRLRADYFSRRIEEISKYADSPNQYSFSMDAFLDAPSEKNLDLEFKRIRFILQKKIGLA